MPRYWARWYEPAPDAWEKVRETLTEFVGEDSAKTAVAALREREFKVEYPFFTIPNHEHATYTWQSGSAMSGEYCVICAVFDAPDEDTVRREIGDRQSVDVTLKADDWTPGDRFPIPADANQ